MSEIVQYYFKSIFKIDQQNTGIFSSLNKYKTCFSCKTEKRLLTKWFCIWMIDFLNITVKSLCIIANINRTTFYAHYDNLFELLEDTKDYIISESLSKIHIHETDVQEDEADHDYLTRDYILSYLRFVTKNQILFKTYSNLSLSITGNDFNSLIENVSKPICLKQSAEVYTLV